MWHRRMTHERLNQKGQRYNLDHCVDGANVHFYTAPSVLDVEKRTRKAEHIDHYVNHHQEDRQPLLPNLFL